jgi:DNA-binding MarR family transcriptional regulator
MLEKGGYIRVVIQGTNTRFFATDHKLDPAEYGISPKDREVLEAVADSPGITQRDLSVRLGRSSSAVSRSVSRLIALGYLVTARKDRGIAVFPRNAAEDMASARPPWPDEGA